MPWPPSHCAQPHHRLCRKKRRRQPLSPGIVLALQDVAANKFLQERFVPKLVASGIALSVDVVRKPDVFAHPGEAIIKRADEIDAALIVVTPHEHEFVEVSSFKPHPLLLSCSAFERCGTP